jgi:hypothetical protein
MDFVLHHYKLVGGKRSQLEVDHHVGHTVFACRGSGKPGVMQKVFNRAILVEIMIDNDVYSTEVAISS